MSLIDIGSPPVFNPYVSSPGYTYIEKANPANDDGTITKVKVWVSLACTALEVGLFEQVSFNTFTTRSHTNLGAVAQGYSEHDVSLTVKTGYFIGFHDPTGKIARLGSGEGQWYYHADKIPCTAQLFTSRSNRTQSIYGEGSTPGVSYRNWTILDQSFVQYCTGYTVTLQTDVPCHLWLRNTPHKTWIHPKQHQRRGISMMTELRHCFVAYNDIEQDESGDTTEHTFQWPNWLWCQYQHYYFWGKSGGVVMVQTSPIFQKFYPQGYPPFLTCERAEVATSQPSYCQEWNAQSQTFTPDHDFFLDYLSLQLCQYEVTRRGPYVVKLTRVNTTPFNEEVIDAFNGHSLNLPAPDTKEWKTFHTLHANLKKDVPYRIVVHTKPGWEWWNGDEWEDWEEGAAIQWWAESDTNPYPRGNLALGANFRDRTGTWTDYPNADATFRLYQRCPSERH